MIGEVASSKTIASYKNSWKTIGFKFLTARWHLKTGQIPFVFHAVSEEWPERFQSGSTLTPWYNVNTDLCPNHPADCLLIDIYRY